MRKMLLAFFCAVILSAMMLPAYAHPGGTDSSGGHRDRSSGEYHYHHGYSAHDHTDMDGDGDLDCPYDFDDRTESEKSNSKDRSSSQNIPLQDIEKSSSRRSSAWNIVKEMWGLFGKRVVLYILLCLIGWILWFKLTLP